MARIRWLALPHLSSVGCLRRRPSRFPDLSDARRMMFFRIRHQLAALLPGGQPVPDLGHALLEA
ncbi:MAG: hypothetical protein ACE5NP_02765 [Anaerolineae bacterium]